MNGRMYDPLVSRFLSPDPYIQAPGFSQNFNRYSYCLNNPLKYTDPDGEKWWHWTIGAALLGVPMMLDPATTAISVSTTATAVLSSTQAVATSYAGTSQGIDFLVTFLGSFYNGLTWTGQRLMNHGKFLIGLFKTDPNLNDGRNTWRTFLRFTWESPQTMAGIGYSLNRNTVGAVDRIDYLGGATFVTNENAASNDGITFGNYINTNIDHTITGDFKDYVTTHPMYMHEYGHYLDSKGSGLLYLPVIGLTSLLSAASSDELTEPPFSTHRDNWTEVRANRRAKKYFGNYYGVDWESHYNGHRGKGEWRKDENGRQYWYYYTIEDYYPTK
jgi:hypothetical protein